MNCWSRISPSRIMRSLLMPTAAWLMHPLKKDSLILSNCSRIIAQVMKTYAPNVVIRLLIGNNPLTTRKCS
ncbi:hypothetical protein PENTCL1PPCAC_3628 [Pristionchus entomophagus]|uniref:Uncharacterized protein n=1 Tax=Pristionchus entomophagus TaxID=358040 RepID=A0AAV5SEG6_9BILA|nr:hypothetical protein PENTCL1PPCAC_3628 [Pristionchus entomophagus]